ncbi:MAG: hypothetical protein RLZZ241_1854 [Bacteroidota bacterium]
MASGKAIFALAMGAFGIALTEFVIMGILPKVAGSLEVSISEAGHFIAIYAFGVVVGAPLMAGFVQRFPARMTLMGLMLWFALFNTFSGFAWDYYSMLTFRFLSGLPHGAFFGMGAVLATRLALPGKEAQGVAKMFAGFTIANVIGVPLGTFIGYEYHWSFSFFLTGGVGLFTVLSLMLWMPQMQSGSVAPDQPKKKGMGNRSMWALLGLTAIGGGGFFAWYSYIAPFLMEIGRLDEKQVSLAMILAGLGMVIGNFLGAKMVSWLKPMKAVFWGMAGMSALLILNSILVSEPVGALIMCFVIGAVTFTMAAPIQMAIMETSKGSEMLASSLNQSAFNIANANGAYLAGLPIAFGYGVISAGRVGALLAALGAIGAILILWGKQNNQSSKSKGV